MHTFYVHVATSPHQAVSIQTSLAVTASTIEDAGITRFGILLRRALDQSCARAHSSGVVLIGLRLLATISSFSVPSAVPLKDPRISFMDESLNASALTDLGDLQCNAEPLGTGSLSYSQKGGSEWDSASLPPDRHMLQHPALIVMDVAVQTSRIAVADAQVQAGVRLAHVHQFWKPPPSPNKGRRKRGDKRARNCSNHVTVGPKELVLSDFVETPPDTVELCLVDAMLLASPRGVVVASGSSCRPFGNFSEGRRGSSYFSISLLTYHSLPTILHPSLTTPRNRLKGHCVLHAQVGLCSCKFRSAGVRLFSSSHTVSRICNSYFFLLIGRSARVFCACGSCQAIAPLCLCKLAS